MYVFLNDAVENKIVLLLRQLVATNPKYREMAPHITSDFPYKEQVQRGVYIEDLSANHQPLAADNYIGASFSHVFMAMVDNQVPENQEENDKQPEVTGFFIEWVKEDETYYSRVAKVDISDQVGTGTDFFILPHQNLIQAPYNDTPASARDIEIWVNGVATRALEVDATNGTFRLEEWVKTGGTVQAAYSFHQTPEEPGLHFIRIDSLDDGCKKGTLSKRLLGVVCKAQLTPSFDPSVTVYNLAQSDLLVGSVRIHTDTHYRLRENVHYDVDYSNGQITILQPDYIPPNRPLYVTYRYDGGQIDGFEFVPGESTNKLVSGAVIAFGNRLKVGDIGVVGVMPERITISEIYGGKWEVSTSLQCYARDPDARQEIVDWFAASIVGVLKPRLDAEGQALTSFSVGGKGRAIYHEQGEDYFIQSLALTLLTDWEIHKSHPLDFDGFEFGVPTETEGLALEPNTRPFKISPEYPVITNIITNMESYR